MEKDLKDLISYVENPSAKDKIVLALHVVLLSQGYHVDLPMQKIGGMVVKAVLPENWREDSDPPRYYTFKYTHPQAEGKELEVKIVVEGPAKLTVFASTINEESALTDFDLPVLGQDASVEDLIEAAKKSLHNAGDPDFLFETRKRKRQVDHSVAASSSGVPAGSSSGSIGDRQPARGSGDPPPQPPQHPDPDFNPPPLPFGGVPAPNPYGGQGPWDPRGPFSGGMHWGPRRPQRGPRYDPPGPHGGDPDDPDNAMRDLFPEAPFGKGGKKGGKPPHGPGGDPFGGLGGTGGGGFGGGGFFS